MERFRSLIAAGKTIFDRDLTFSIQISMYSVKIIKPVFQKCIYHLTGLLFVNFSILQHRKTHAPKSKILFYSVHSYCCSFIKSSPPFLKLIAVHSMFYSAPGFLLPQLTYISRSYILFGSYNFIIHHKLHFKSTIFLASLT